MADAAAPQIHKLFIQMEKVKASDLHLRVGEPPVFRIAGLLHRTKLPPLNSEQVAAIALEILTPTLREEFERNGAVDFAHRLPNGDRFRLNVFHQQNNVGLVARRIDNRIPSMEELNLPPGTKQIPGFDHGIVLIAGITGAGKSTTLAAMIDEINHARPVHIVTIENPIEYVYEDDQAVINQRELGVDTPNFAQALKDVLREDPDVILIGEMRDVETFETALIAAETGHLVFGTIHAASAVGVIGRILDLFPAERHDQIRQMLHMNLRAVVVQKLLRSIRPDAPRVPACEIMIVNPAIRKYIRDNEDHKIHDVIRGGREEGMQDMNQALVELVRKGWVTPEMALDESPNPEGLAMNLKGIYVSTDRSG